MGPPPATSTTQQGQSPWLDNLTPRLAHQRRAPARGSTAASGASRRTRRSSRRPSSAGDDYDEQFGRPGRAAGASDRRHLLGPRDRRHHATRSRILRPVYDASDGVDGFVSVEVAPDAGPRHRRHRSPRPAHLHDRIDRAQPVREDPRHRRGPPRHPADDRRGPQHQRHADLLPRPLRARSSRPTSPASRRCDGRPVAASRQRGLASSSAGSTPRSTAASTPIGTAEALALRGKAAVAQAPARLRSCSWRRSRGPRWEALAARGARVQRPLWASTSTKNPAYPDTLYVDTLIGPDTVNTMPEATLDGLRRPRHRGPHDRRRPRTRPRPRWTPRRGGRSTSTTSAAVLEDEGVASFAKCFDELLGALDTKAAELRPPGA